MNAQIFYFYLMNIQNATLNKQYPNNITIMFVIFHELFNLKTRLEKAFYYSNFFNYLIGIV